MNRIFLQVHRALMEPLFERGCRRSADHTEKAGEGASTEHACRATFFDVSEPRPSRPGSGRPAPHAGGASDLVVLDPDHPGFRDADYRRRRNEIARMALDYRDGD